jgi:hypothetical protein
MSLEEKVDALTAAIAGLTVAMHAQIDALTPTGTVARDEAVPPAKAEAPKKAAPAKAAKKEEPKTEAELVITFEDLKKAVVAAADKDKPATAAALKALGVAKISELKEDRYAAAHEALIAVVEGEPDTTQDASFL